MDKESEIILVEVLILRLLVGLAPDEIVAIALQSAANKYKKYIHAKNATENISVGLEPREGGATSIADDDFLPTRKGKGITDDDVPRM